MLFLFYVLLFVLIIVFLIMSMKIKIKIQDIQYNSHKHIQENIYKEKEKTHFNSNYNFTIILYTLNIIPIFKIKITKKTLDKLNRKTHIKQKIEEKINEEELIKLEEKYNLKKDFMKIIKNIKISIEEIDLKIEIGTENAILTSFIVPTISTILAILIVNSKNNIENKKFKITPIYQNKNIVKVNVDGNIIVKFSNIVNTIYILNNNKKVKNENKINDWKNNQIQQKSIV